MLDFSGIGRWFSFSASSGDISVGEDQGGPFFSSPSIQNVIHKLVYHCMSDEVGCWVDTVVNQETRPFVSQGVLVGGRLNCFDDWDGVFNGDQVSTAFIVIDNVNQFGFCSGF